MTRRAILVTNLVGWMLMFAGVVACGCWLASLRKDEYLDRVTIIEWFGRPGWDWYLDFLRGEARFVVKDYDLVVLYLAVPGWSAAVALLLTGTSLLIWNRGQAIRTRGFELQSMTLRGSQLPESE